MSLFCISVSDNEFIFISVSDSMVLVLCFTTNVAEDNIIQFVKEITLICTLKY
jgi:hypothetical protein